MGVTSENVAEFERFRQLVEQVDFGKQLSDAVYVHRSGWKNLPMALRELLNAAIAQHRVPKTRWTVCKLYKRDHKVSFLVYPEFNLNPYPPLRSSYLVDLGRGSCNKTDFSRSTNPPILHRRETFLPPGHPKRDDYAAYTREGEVAGLYEHPRRIGFKQQWERLIREKGYQLVDGHLVPLSDESREGASDPPSNSEHEVHRHKTAIERDQLSAPLQVLARHGYLDGSLSILDYGCGKGDDVRELEAHGLDVRGWDPVYHPAVRRKSSDIVNLGFVINVIEDRGERAQALREAYALTQQVLAVSVMLGGPAIRHQFKPYKDGVLTARNTFQKYYTQSELRAYIEHTLETNAIATAPGVFLVFKDELEEQRFLLERQKVRREWRQLTVREKRSRDVSADELLAREPDLFESFWRHCLDLGRMPANDEFEHSEAIRRIAGSHAKAFDAAAEVYERSQFDRAQQGRRDDLLVYFALGFFGGRKAYRHMPESLRRDVKAFFGKYTDALAKARELLFSIARTDLIEQASNEAYDALGCGHLNPGHSLILHQRYIEELPAILRVYVGAASQLFGDLEGVDLVKIHFTSGKVSLLFYDNFEGKEKPQLLRRVKIRLRDQDFDEFDHATDPHGQLEDKTVYWAQPCL